LKTELASFDVAVLVHELEQVIKDSRIENIYQIGSKTFLLRLHKTNNPTMQLLVEAGKWMHLTTYVRDKPAKPPAFCMVLRKHLDGGRIEEVAQHEFERTVKLTILGRHDTLQLIVELFGNGNTILVNSQNAIVAALAYMKMRDRNILRNEQFKQAPSSGANPFNLAPNDLDSLKSYNGMEIVRGLARFLGIGGLYAEEVLLRANLDKKTPCEQLTPQQIDAIHKNLQEILSFLRKGEFDPAIVISEEDDWVDVTPIKLKKYEHMKTQPYTSFNQALDEYHTHAFRTIRVSETQNQYEKELAKQQRMLNEQQETLKDAKKAVEQNKRVGDLIYSHFGELQLLQQQISNAKQMGESWEQIITRLKKEKELGRSPAVYFDTFNPKILVLTLSVDGVVFPLQINRSVQANAAEYYERMKKAERKLEGAKKAMLETQRRIDELREKWTRKIEDTRAEVPSRQVRKNWYEKFRWFTSSEGFLVLGGRDAITNEILIKKHLEPSDLVLHADVVGAPFVVIKTEQKQPSQQTIQEAAEFAAAYSRAWREMLSAVDVYWVRPEQLSKTAPSGQYLERGAFIVQGTKNYLRKIPLKIAIGVRKDNESMQVISGPLKAIRERTITYVEVVPGDLTSAELAKQMRRMLAGKASNEERSSIMKIRLEEIQQLIPLGKGLINSGGK